MPNGFELIWAPQALHDLDEIFSYFELQWTEKEIRQFSKDLDNTLLQLTQLPFIGMASEKSINFRKFVFSKQTTIYYEVRPNTIVLTGFSDNRQNPENIPY